MENNQIIEQRPTTPTPEASGDQGERLFTQQQVNDIIRDRLSRERERSLQSPDVEAMRQELDRYREAEKKRLEEAEAARLDAILTQTAESALEGKEFVNDITRSYFVNELKKAIQDPANKGKDPSALFDHMTKDLDGIFRNPQHDKVIIKGVDYNGGALPDAIAAAFRPKI